MSDGRFQGPAGYIRPCNFGRFRQRAAAPSGRAPVASASAIHESCSAERGLHRAPEREPCLICKRASRASAIAQATLSTSSPRIFENSGSEPTTRRLLDCRRRQVSHARSSPRRLEGVDFLLRARLEASSRRVAATSMTGLTGGMNSPAGGKALLRVMGRQTRSVAERSHVASRCWWWPVPSCSAS